MGRVEERRGAASAIRFLSPLIKPDVRISRIRLSDWFHRGHTAGCRYERHPYPRSALTPRYSSLGKLLVSCGAYRLAPIHRPSPSSPSTPEVRGLPSTRIARLQQYYDPVRLPPAAAAGGNVEAATLAPDGSPPLPASPVRRAVPATPADRDGCTCRLLPRSRGLPRFAGGSASAPLLSRPAQASLTLRPVGLLSHPTRPLPRGFDPAGHPTKPPVSYQSNRQLSGWILPPLVKRALGAHCKNEGGSYRVPGWWHVL